MRQLARDSQQYVEFAFCPSGLLISVMRRFVSDFYAETIGDPDLISRLAMVTHELLENAAKYSLDGEARLRIEWTRERGGSMTILVRNRASTDQVRTVRETIDRMRTGKRDTLYATFIEESVTRPLGSMLGLPRIWAEGEMDLSCDVEGDTMTIRAECDCGTALST